MSPRETPSPDDQPGVLSGLSRTRPQRRSTKRPGAAATPAGPAVAKAKPAAAKAKPAAAKPKPAPAKAKPATAKTKAKASPAPAKKPAAAKAKPTTAKPKAPAKQAAATPPTPAPRRIEPVMARPEPREDQPAREPAPAQQPVGGTELVAQAIQAAGEVANLGVGIGKQVAKGVLRRLPRP